MKTEEEVRKELKIVQEEIHNQKFGYSSNLNAWEDALRWVLK